MEEVLPPAPRPCASCPYRRDVPSGLWDESEYAKLPRYDAETGHQPTGLFLCHQRDRRMCAGHVATHDMAESMALRIHMLTERPSEEFLDAVLDYTTEVPCFESGAAAAAHGRAEIASPGPEAQRLMGGLRKKVGP